jgi:hypothetical protein
LNVQEEQDLQDLIDAGDVPEPSTQLSFDDKVKWAANRQRFTVLGVTIGSGSEFGGYWEVNVEADTNPWIMQVAMHEKRDPFMEALAAKVVNGPIGNCMLVNKGGSKGNPFLVIAPWREE